MTLTQLLIVIALVLGLITVIQSKATNLLAWAVVLLSVVLLAPVLR